MVGSQAAKKKQRRQTKDEKLAAPPAMVSRLLPAFSGCFSTCPSALHWLAQTTDEGKEAGQQNNLAVTDPRHPVRMANGTVVFLPPNAANQAGQGLPGAAVIQPPGTIQYVQYGGLQLRNPSNPQVRPLEKFLKVETKTLGTSPLSDNLAVTDLRHFVRMDNRPAMFFPSDGSNVYQADQRVSGTTVNQPQYVQTGGQESRTPSNPPQVRSLEQFLKAEAKVLGAIQIFNGLMHIGLGAVLAVVSDSDYSPVAVQAGYVFWGAVFVKSCVALNITSAVLAVVGIILLIVELAVNPAISSTNNSTSLAKYSLAQ
ncbi:hypothetical protein JD844_022130, partial [Phrynosoma platyrhinos]